MSLDLNQIVGALTTRKVPNVRGCPLSLCLSLTAAPLAASRWITTRRMEPFSPPLSLLSLALVSVARREGEKGGGGKTRSHISRFRESTEPERERSKRGKPAHLIRLFATASSYQSRTSHSSEILRWKIQKKKLLIVHVLANRRLLAFLGEPCEWVLPHKMDGHGPF